MPKRKIDWSQVDWSRKLKDIAAELGCHTDSAAKAKSRAGLTTPRAPVELRKAKRKESMKKDSAKRYAAAKADGRCLKCMKAQADPTHKTCSPCREKMRKYNARASSPSHSQRHNSASRTPHHIKPRTENH